MHHTLTRPREGAILAGQNGAPPAPTWPNYRGTSQFVGFSPDQRIAVYVDPSLGAPGLANAQDLVADSPRILDANDAIFGTKAGSVSVIVYARGGSIDGGGGADHMGCDYSTGAAIEVCASFGASARVSALFEAELSECSMGGNLCGVSTGEALSRWCASVISGNALADYATAPFWAQNGMPDFVNRTDASDTNPASTGCGMAFISWLMSLGHSLNAIAPAMVSLGDAGTLAGLYAQLSSDSSSAAWPNFMSAVTALPNGVTSDDPFGGAAHVGHLAYLPTATVDTAGRIFSAILLALAAGKNEEQIVRSVRNVMSGISPTMNGTGAAACSTRSHPLLPPVRRGAS